MNSDSLQAVDIHAGYPGRSVLFDVSLELRRGDATAIIGPNGAGKSTLLKVMAGGLHPAGGEVLLDGMPLRSVSRRVSATRIAFVPQNLAVGFGLTAREVVMLGRTPYVGFLGVPTRHDRTAVAQAMRETDTMQLADRPFAKLSGGEAQRVILAMALAQEPDFLLLDEPTVHLDLGQQWKFISHLFQLRDRSGVGVLAVVHDLNLAGTMFERVVLLESGRIAADGPPSSVL